MNAEERLYEHINQCQECNNIVICNIARRIIEEGKAHVLKQRQLKKQHIQGLIKKGHTTNDK